MIRVTGLRKSSAGPTPSARVLPRILTCCYLSSAGSCSSSICWVPNDGHSQQTKFAPFALFDPAKMGKPNTGIDTHPGALKFYREVGQAAQ